jgi:hypothetical protein
VRLFENRMNFGPKKEEVIGGWRKLHNKGLLIKYCYGDRSRSVKWMRRVTYGAVENCIQEFGGETWWGETT